jgi:hypothetical protein
MSALFVHLKFPLEVDAPLSMKGSTTAQLPASDLTAPALLCNNRAFFPRSPIMPRNGPPFVEAKTYFKWDLKDWVNANHPAWTPG